ncbi:MAG: 23S rRNA (guanosine(2251)-2'-O)-methyltransferase RlmB [Deltaproteobacteria bacterium]|nr:MAG: 23S rRNA (guanosine(2251)-2'-O)-methyltransferase RlmB [Deltaproteobacteria bacterium]
MLIPGYHAAIQSIPAGKKMIKEVWIAEGKTSKRASRVEKLAQAHGIKISYKSKAELDSLLPGISHQGIVLLAEDFKYTDLEQAVQLAGDSLGQPIFVIADHITDEGNLGSIIRTSAFFGISGLIIPKDRSASVSPRVLKRAVGCHLYLPISRVVNLSRALDYLEQKEFWIIGAAGEANKSIYDYDWQGPTALVVGSEDKGLSQGIRKKCHELLSIPSYGGIDSLNVGVATGIILAEARRRSLSRRQGNGVSVQRPATD